MPFDLVGDFCSDLNLHPLSVGGFVFGSLEQFLGLGVSCISVEPGHQGCCPVWGKLFWCLQSIAFSCFCGN